MNSRRSFLTVAAAVAATAAGVPRARGQVRQPTIDVKKIGASGGGKVSDLRPIRRALEIAAEHRAGATIYFPPGDYYLGAVEEGDLLVLQNLQNIRFVGDRATISCRTSKGRLGIIVIAGSRDIGVEGLSFRDYGLDRDHTWGAYAISFVGDARRTGSENIKIADCTFDSVLAAVAAHGDDGRAPPVRGISLKNLTVSRSVYGFNFAHSGDEVTGRELTCVDVMRSYFPYGVSKHDIEVDTKNNATGMTDVLISCYHKNTTDIRLKLKSRGKRGGDTIINFDHQNHVPGLAIRNIQIEADIDDVNCSLNAAIQFRAMNPTRHIERVTDRRWDSISLDGDIRICDLTKLIYFESVNRTPGRIEIGPRLARHPRLPKSFPGFDATVRRT